MHKHYHPLRPYTGDAVNVAGQCKPLTCRQICFRRDFDILRLGSAALCGCRCDIILRRAVSTVFLQPCLHDIHLLRFLLRVAGVIEQRTVLCGFNIVVSDRRNVARAVERPDQAGIGELLFDRIGGFRLECIAAAE